MWAFWYTIETMRLLKKFLFLSILTASLILLSVPVAQASGINSATNPGTVSIQNTDGTLQLTTSPTDTSGNYGTINSNQRSVLMNGAIILPQAFFSDFPTLFNRMLTLVIAIAALLVFVYLIWGGIDWITSGGDKGKTEQARQKIVSAVIGLLVVAASYAILTLTLNFLGYDSLTDVFSDTRTPLIILPASTPTATTSATPIPTF